MGRLLIQTLFVAGLTLLMAGCASVERYTPIAIAQVHVNMDKSQYTVLGTVKGTSTMDSFFCGFIRVIDGSHVSLLGMKFFEDQYAYYNEKPSIFGVSVEDRAYYKALCATPDADALLRKSSVTQESGTFLLYSQKEVTFTGKAIKYKAD